MCVLRHEGNGVMVWLPAVGWLAFGLFFTWNT